MSVLARGAPDSGVEGACHARVLHEADVAIVGAGPTGLLLANLLGVFGTSTIVIERRASGAVAPLGEPPGSAALDAAGLRALDAAGLLEALDPALVRGFDAEWVDARGRVLLSVPLAESRLGQPDLASVDPDALRSVLSAGLERFPHVARFDGHELLSLANESTAVLLETRPPGGEAVHVRASFVVGADGAESRVRRLCGIPTTPLGRSERWLIADVVDPFLDDTLACRFFADPTRPAATLRRSGGRRRWEWKLRPDEREDEVLRDEFIQRLVSPWTRTEGLVIERRGVRRLAPALAARLREGRVLLAGEAAHAVPPQAGQDLAASLRDAFDLAWRLWLATSGRAGPALLADYDLERRAAARRALRDARRLGGALMPRSRGLATLRDGVLAGVRRIPEARAWIVRRVRRVLRPRRLAQGSFVREVLPPSAGRRRRGVAPSRVGAVVWQPRLCAADGTLSRLDTLLGAGFAVLGFGVDPRLVQGEKTRAYWDSLGARMVHVAPRGEAVCGDAWSDVDGEVEAWLRERREAVVVVRPDRRCAIDAPPERFAADTDAWRRHIGA